MRCRLLLALTAILGTTAFAPAPFPRPEKVDPTGLTGTWAVVRYERGGAPVGGQTLKARIEKNKWTFLHVNADSTTKPTAAYFITIDPKKAPRSIDLTHVSSKRKLRGIYRCDSGQLHVAFHSFWVNERPTEFDGTDKRVFHMLLKKDQP
jgi:uncharacterized protein (TIGR03067 family)